MNYLSSKAVAQVLGVAAQTLKNCNKEGRLKLSYTKGNGYRYYYEEAILAYRIIMYVKKNLM